MTTSRAPDRPRDSITRGDARRPAGVAAGDQRDAARTSVSIVDTQTFEMDEPRASVLLRDRRLLRGRTGSAGRAACAVESSTAARRRRCSPTPSSNMEHAASGTPRSAGAADRGLALACHAIAVAIETVVASRVDEHRPVVGRRGARRPADHRVVAPMECWRDTGRRFGQRRCSSRLSPASRRGSSGVGQSTRSGSAPDRDPLGGPDLETEVALTLPSLQDLQLAATVDVVEHHDGVTREALGERRQRRIAAELDPSVNAGGPSTKSTSIRVGSERDRRSAYQSSPSRASVCGSSGANATCAVSAQPAAARPRRTRAAHI